MHATNTIKAIRWLAKTLELSWPLGSPMFRVFDAARDRQRRESLPLPLGFLVFLERLLRDEQAETAMRIVAGAFLVMVGASLRFSDVTHVKWNELSMDTLDLRGIVCRTKMARSDMPFAVAGDGMLGVVDCQGRAWPAVFLMLMSSVWQEARDCLGAGYVPDVLLFTCAEFRPWSYAQALKILRDLLAQHMPQCADVAMMSYTLHSCKATYLSYMSQCNLGRTDRRLQGHHRSGAVELYARDDTFGALRAQREVRRGWLCLPRPLLVGVVRQCRPSLCL